MEKAPAVEQILSPEEAAKIKNEAIERMSKSLLGTLERNAEHSVPKKVQEILANGDDVAKYLAELQPSLLGYMYSEGLTTSPNSELPETKFMQVSANFLPPEQIAELLGDQLALLAEQAKKDYKMAYISRPDYTHVVVPLGDGMDLVCGVVNTSRIGEEPQWSVSNSYVRIPWESEDPEDLDGHGLVNLLLEHWEQGKPEEI